MYHRQCAALALATALHLCASVTQAAEQDTVQAVIPWEAEGRVFQIGADKQQFLGALDGILYVESSEGDIHEAFVMCPVVQNLDEETGESEATAHCEIIASGEDVAYAKMTCKGTAGDCEGKFTLTGGVGEFAGISGEGSLRVRSPIGVLITDVAAGTELSIGAGLAIIKDLEYRIP